MTHLSDQARAVMEGEKLLQYPLQISPHEVTILRTLAERLREIASWKEQEEKRKLWYAVNALRPIRPIVFCDPEKGWNEIIPPETLRCQGLLAREWEMKLRKEIFWGESMHDDKVIEPYFDLPYLYRESDWGMRERKIGGKKG